MSGAHFILFLAVLGLNLILALRALEQKRWVFCAAFTIMAAWGLSLIVKSIRFL